MSDNIKIKARLKAFSKLNDTIKIDTENVITDAPTSSNEVIYGRQNKEWVDIGEKFKLTQLAQHQNEIDDNLTSLDNKVNSNVSNLQNQIDTEVQERTEDVEELNRECNDLNSKVSSIKIEVDEIGNIATFSGAPGTTETATFRTGHNIDNETIILNRDNQLQTNLNLVNGEGNYSISQKYQVNGEDYSAKATGENSVAFGGKRTGDKYKNDPTTQARGVQSFAAGASCEADGEASISLGMGAKAYQRSSASIGKACRSGLTIVEFNDKYATDTQKATTGYDNTKINGGVPGLSIKDNHEDEYSTSYSSSFASGVETKASGWGAFTGGLNNTSAADGAATFGNNNINSGINAFVAGVNNEATVPKSFLFGEGLKQTKGDSLAFVIGKYNEDKGDYIFAISAGTETSPKNIFTVNKSSGRVDMTGEAYCEAPSVGYESATSNSIINKGILSPLLASKSNATNWRNGSGVATVVLQEAANTSGSSKRTVVAGHNSKATNADGSAIIAGYSNNVASSFCSSILNGKFNEATHNSCIVGGVGNKTNSNDQTIFGTYSSLDKDALFIIGNGTGDDLENRNNALTVRKDGRVEVTGTPKNIHDVVRLQELDTINTNLSNLDTKYEDITNSLKNDKLNKVGGTITGDLSITGNLTVNGKQEAVETTSLKVDDPVIITNGSKVPLTTILSGLAINTNEEDSYGIVYNNDKDAVELGLGKVSESGIFTFNANEGKPLAVRDDSSNLNNGHLIKWDSGNRKLIDSGKTTTDFVEVQPFSNPSAGTSYESEVAYNAYTVDKDGNTGVIPISANRHSGNTLVLRFNDGRISASDAIDPHNVTTKTQVETAITDAITSTKEEFNTSLSTKLDKPAGLDATYKLVTTNDSSSGTLSYTDAPTGFTVMQRNADGRAQVEAGTSGKEIVNFDQLETKSSKLYLHNVSMRLKYDPNVDLYVSWKVLNSSSTPFHQNTEATLDMAPPGKWFDFHAHGKFTLGANTIDSPYILKFYPAAAYRYYSSEGVVTYEWQFDEPTYVNAEGIVVTITSAEPDYYYYSMVTPTSFIDNVVEL